MICFAERSSDVSDLAVLSLAHGVPRVDDRRMVSGIVYVIRNGLQWKGVLKDCGPHKTFYNRFIR